ncbi:MAG: coenzyme F420-0:L-glutamate ligase [Candidatus Villigracilaceae bacterium]
MALTLTPLAGFPLVLPGDDLAGLLLKACQQTGIEIAENDIFVLTSKIVSKAERRLVRLSNLKPSDSALDLAERSQKDPRLCELILRESREILRVRPGTIIVEHRLGFVCASAGIDQSNIAPSPNQSPNVSRPQSEDWALLLPENPDRSALQIRRSIEQATGKRVGVMIIDSHGRAWRIGTVGVCIGLSGLPAIVDERGWKDLFGRELRITIVGVADELAAAASLMMGQAAEGTPAVHVRGFPYPLGEGSLQELLRPREQDMFR